MPVNEDLLGLMSPEGQLLMLAAGPSENDDLIRSLAARPLDWAGVFWLAERERAASILLQRLDDVGATGIPKDLHEALRRRAMVAAFSAAHMEQRLGETLAAFQSQGVESVLLKGAALALVAYRGFTDRPMGDIDLLVDGRDAERAWRLAQREGWTWDASLHPLENYIGHHHLPPLVGARGLEVKLEVHSALFVRGSPFSLDLAEMRFGATRHAVGRGEGLVPKPSRLLVHVAMHYAWSHMMLFGGWRAFRDVGALVPLVDDWGDFVETARRNRAESVCYWTLALAARLCGARVPPSVLAQLSREAGVREWGVLERHFVGELTPGPRRCPSAYLRRRLWEIAISPDAAGHGPTRPWTLDDSLAAPSDGQLAGGILRRTLRQLERPVSWLRYLGSLLMTRSAA